MNESNEKPIATFKHPDVYKEAGEFQRISNELGIPMEILESQALQGELINLGEDLWEKLENTDSNEIEFGNFEKVESLSKQVGRDWEGIRDKLTFGKQIDAPIIIKYGDRYIKVSGNTRLMVAKAMGVIPRVFLVEIDT